MIEEYFDFEKFWKEEIISNFKESDIEDFDIELDNLTASEATTYLKNMPFPLCLSECELRLEENEILFDFSKEINQSNESGYDASYFRVFVTWSITEELITSIGYEQG